MKIHVLSLINAPLMIVCFGCVWYLATASYTPPKEIALAEKWLTQIPQSTPAPTPTPTPPPTLDGLDKRIFPPLYTPTSTPTPTPTPTPEPPDLRSVTDGWEITSIDGQAVEFNGLGQTFTLTVGGAPFQAIDGHGRPTPVTLLSVDSTQNKVTLGCQGQTVEKSMF